MTDYPLEKKTCWFCEKEIADPGASYIVKMYGNVKRTGSHKRFRLTWDNKTVKIPQCEKCKRVHAKFTRTTNIAVISALIPMICLFVIFMSVSSIGLEISKLGWVGLGAGSLVIAVGSIVVGVRRMQTLNKIKSYKDHPDIRSRLKDGWKLGDRPEAYERT